MNNMDNQLNESFIFRLFFPAKTFHIDFYILVRFGNYIGSSSIFKLGHP